MVSGCFLGQRSPAGVRVANDQSAVGFQLRFRQPVAVRVPLIELGQVYPGSLQHRDNPDIVGILGLSLHQPRATECQNEVDAQVVTTRVGEELVVFVSIVPAPAHLVAAPLAAKVAQQEVFKRQSLAFHSVRRIFEHKPFERGHIVLGVAAQRCLGCPDPDQVQRLQRVPRRLTDDGQVAGLLLGHFAEEGP